MEINITYKSPEHEAAFLSELQRMRNSKTLEEAVEKVKALLNK